MIGRKILAMIVTCALCAPAFGETEKYQGPNIYVPSSRLEKVYQVPEGEIYAVRRTFKQMGDFSEVWARLVPRNTSQATLDFWKNEGIAVSAQGAYTHFNVHFYCNTGKAAIPAAYQFDTQNQLITSLVVLMDKPFSVAEKPVTMRLSKMACSGELDNLQ